MNILAEISWGKILTGTGFEPKTSYSLFIFRALPSLDRKKFDDPSGKCSK